MCSRSNSQLWAEFEAMKLIFETISRYVVSTETNMSSSQMTSMLKWDCKGCNETLKSLNWSQKNQSCSCLKRRRKDKVRYTSRCYQWWAPVMSEALCPVMGTSGQEDNPMRPPGDHVRCHMPDHSLITQRGQWIRVSKQTWDYSAYVPGITDHMPH